MGFHAWLPPGGEHRAGRRVHTPSRVAPSVGRHQLPRGSSTYLLLGLVGLIDKRRNLCSFENAAWVENNIRTSSFTDMKLRVSYSTRVAVSCIAEPRVILCGAVNHAACCFAATQPPGVIVRLLSAQPDARRAGVDLLRAA